MTITVLPSAHGEEMLGQLETNLLWDAQDSVVHEGNGKCSWVEDMSSFKGTKALRPQMLTARVSKQRTEQQFKRRIWGEWFLWKIVRPLLLSRHHSWHAAAPASGILLMSQLKFWHQEWGHLGKDMETFKQRLNLFSRIFFLCCCLMSKHGNFHQNLREGIFWMNFSAREKKKIVTQHTEGVISLDREMSDIMWIEVMLNALSLFIPRPFQV